MAVLSLRSLIKTGQTQQQQQSPERGKHETFFFLKALGILSTGNHLSGGISLKMRVFLNPSLLWAYAAWYFCSEQRSYLANEPNYPKGLCLSLFYDTTRSKSYSTDSHSCVCSRAHFRMTFEMWISRSSTVSMGCFIPTSWVFHALS